MGGKPRRRRLSEGLAGTLQALAAVLEAHRGHAMVIGGIGVIARGVRRLTRDVDAAIEGGSVDPEVLVDELATVGIAPRIPDALGFAAESQVLLMRHVASGVDVDVSMAWTAFENEAIARASLETVAQVDLPIARPDDLIIFKCIAWRPQDQQDVERLLALHAGQIDLQRIRHHVANLSRALEVDRLPELDSLVQRVIG
jgi:uncharacterized nucleotidyltransferase DUF6036